jgi:hypothetical protein
MRCLAKPIEMVDATTWTSPALAFIQHAGLKQYLTDCGIVR